MDAASIDPGKTYLIGGAALKKLVKRQIKVNKDDLSIKTDGDDQVLSFANSTLVFFIQNGVPAAGLIPLRKTAPPA